MPVILVGGKGRRLGKDKVFLSLKKKPFIHRTYRILKTVCGKEPIFVGRGVLPFPYVVIPDVVKGIGPKGGLLTAFLNTNTDFVFLTACDMPFINMDLLTYMSRTLKKSSEIYMPRLKNGYLEPLFAFYRKSLLHDLKKQIKCGEYRMRTLIKGHTVQYIEEEEVENIDRELMTFFNINIKSDLDKALEVMRNEKN
jgi:molybdopterin-guanine dinucleotide biosynthesis protein A